MQKQCVWFFQISNLLSFKAPTHDHNIPQSSPYHELTGNYALMPSFSAPPWRIIPDDASCCDVQER